MKKIVSFYLFFLILYNFNVFGQQNSKTTNDGLEVIVYGSDECHHCIETKNFLKEKKIAFVFYDIDKQPEALNEMLTKLRKANISTSNLGIPVVDKKGVLFLNNGDFQEFLKKLE